MEQNKLITHLKSSSLETIQRISENNDIFFDNSIIYTVLNKNQRVLKYMLDSDRFYDIAIYSLSFYIMKIGKNIQEDLNMFRQNFKFIKHKVDIHELNFTLNRFYKLDMIKYNDICVIMLENGAKFENYDYFSINLAIKHSSIENIPEILLKYYYEISRESIDFLFNKCSVFPTDLVNTDNIDLNLSKDASIFLYIEELFENFHDFCLNNDWFFNELALDSRYLHLTKYSNIEDLLFRLVTIPPRNKHIINSHNFTEEHIDEDYIRNFINETTDVWQILILLCLYLDIDYLYYDINVLISLNELSDRKFDITSLSNYSFKKLTEFFESYELKDYKDAVIYRRELIKRGFKH